MISLAVGIGLLALTTVGAALTRRLAPTYEGLGYLDGRPFPLKLTPIGGGFLLRADAALAFLRMAAAAALDGVLFKINTAFRTMEEQEHLYWLYLRGQGDGPTAKPGYSNHQQGTTVDLDTAGGTNAAYQWLTKNAARFGFKRTVSSEPWHWEYRPTEVNP